MTKTGKSGIWLLALIFAFMTALAAPPDVWAAIWDTAGRTSKVKKESYERLVKKNLELRDQVESLIKEEEQLREIYKLLLEKVKAFQRDNALLEKERKRSDEVESQSRRTIDELKRKLADTDTRITSMETLAGKVGVEVRKGIEVPYEDKIKRLKAEVDSFEKRYNKALAEKEDLRKELDGVRAGVGRTDEETVRLKEELKTYYDKLAEQNGRLRSLEEQLQTAIAGQESASGELTAARRALEAKDAELKSQYEKVASYEEAQKTADTLKKGYEAKTNEAAALSQKLERMEETVRRNKEFESALAKDEAQIKADAETIAGLKERVETATSTLKDTQKEVEDLSGTRVTQDGRIKELERSLSENKQRAEEETRRFKAQAARVNDLEKELARVSEALMRTNKELAAKNKDTKELKEMFDKKNLKKDYPEVFKEKDPLEEYKASPVVAKVKEAIRRIELSCKAKKDDAGILQERAAGLSAEKTALRNKIDSARADIKMFNESIAQVNAGAGGMNEEASAEEERLKVLKDAVERAASEEKDARIAFEEAGKRVSQAEESLKKLTANTAGKTKIEELNALEASLNKARENESAAGQIAKDAEDKVKNLEVEIDDAQVNVKKALAAKAASEKEKIKALKENIANAVLAEDAATNKLQRLARELDVAGRKREALLADIRLDEKEISDLKRIIEKEVIEISAAQADAQASKKGLSEEARSTLTLLKDEINTLKAENKKLEKELQQSQRSELEVKRKLNRDKMIPEDLKRRVDKERLDMHYNLAVVYDTSGRYEDARREYLKCLKIDPKDAGVHYNLGILYDDKLNDNRKAEYHYRQFLKFRPMGQEAVDVRRWLTNIELESRLGKEMR